MLSFSNWLENNQKNKEKINLFESIVDEGLIDDVTSETDDEDVWGGRECSVIDFEDDEELSDEETNGDLQRGEGYPYESQEITEDRPTANFQLKKTNDTESGWEIINKTTNERATDSDVAEYIERINKRGDKKGIHTTYENGDFKVNGKVMTKEEILKNILNGINGYTLPSHNPNTKADRDRLSDMYDKKKRGKGGKSIGKRIEKLENKIKNADWWKHYSILLSGSKVGKSGNFSLPPGYGIDGTCGPHVPCASDGCYAMKSYNQYPLTKAAWIKNKDLLNNIGTTKLVNEITEIINKHKLEYFRFNVSGDLNSLNYLKAIIAIANKNGGCQFWLYTKRFVVENEKYGSKDNDVKIKNGHGVNAEIQKYLIENAKNLPKNLNIILSAWNDYIPPKELQELYSVAYLDDVDQLNDEYKSYDKDIKDPKKKKKIKYKNKEEILDAIEKRKIYLKGINSNRKTKICPCSSHDENETNEKCDNCRACCPNADEKTDIVFKKH